MPFAVKVGEFDGPLDLLLGLIEERKMHINDVGLAQVTDDYLSYVQSHGNFPLGEVSQFILVASTLLLIKSRSLLPNLELTDEEQMDVAELERRLKHYQIIKRAARALYQQWGLTPLRAPSQAPMRMTARFAPGDITLVRLVEVLKKLISVLPTTTFREVARVASTITLEEMIDKLKERIMKAAKTRFRDLTNNASSIDVVIHFLALLELIKDGFVAAAQDKPFSDIMLESNQVGTPRYGA